MPHTFSIPPMQLLNFLQNFRKLKCAGLVNVVIILVLLLSHVALTSDIRFIFLFYKIVYFTHPYYK